MHFKPGHPSWAGARRARPTSDATAQGFHPRGRDRAGNGDIVAYLGRQAEENPAAFLGLLGRVLPLQLQNDRDNPDVITQVVHLIVDTREQAEMIELSALTNGTKEPN